MTDSPFSKQPKNLYQDSDLPAGISLDQQHSPNHPGQQRLASVLLPLHRIEQSWQLLFIRRSENRKDRHSGQVAFPGGARDPADNDPIETALRETEEEIGVSRDAIKVVSTLPIYTTSSYFQVTPVVGLMDWPVSITPAPDEVARVFSIPLEWLKDHDNFELRARTGSESESRNHHPVIYFNRYGGELLWGASARMTLNLIRALDDGQVVLPD